MIRKTIVVLLILFMFLLSGCKEDIIYTEDLSSYESFVLNKWDIFPNNIPDNVEVIKFSYYKYYGEDSDVYLELKFETLSDMKSYLDQFKDELLINYPSNKALYNESCFFETINPYDENYREMFYLKYAAFRPSDNSHRVGYTTGNSTGVFYCAIISYSENDLCVIHSRTHGTFNKNNKHTPIYLDRFGITTDEDHDRMYVFIEKDSKLVLKDEI